MPSTSNLRPVPFAKGNRLAERHGFYSSVLTAVECEEVDEIASALRELTPIDSNAIEPLIQLVSAQIWRRRKAYADLAAIPAGGTPAHAVPRRSPRQSRGGIFNS